MSRRSASGASRPLKAPSSAATAPRPELGPHAAALILTSLLVATPLLVIAQYPGSPSLVSLTGWLQFTLLAYTATRLSWTLVRGVPDLLIGVFWVFAYAALVVPAIVQRASGIRPWGVPLDEADLLTAQFVVLLSLVTIDVTYRSVLGRRRASPRIFRVSTVRTQLLPVLALVYVPVLALLIQRRGGLGTLFVSRSQTLSEAAIASGVDYGLIAAGVRVVPTVILGAALVALRRRPERSLALWYVVAAYVPIVLVVTNPISTNRYSFIAATLFLLLCAYRPSRRFRQVTIVGTVLGALVVFPYLDWFRYRRSGAGATGLEALTTGDYDALFTTTMAVRWVVENGITWGYQALGVFGFWVPRSIWPGKPNDTGVAVAEGLGMTYTNLSSPLWAEGYVNFGVVGAVLAAAAFGVFAARLAASHLGTADDRGDLIWAYAVGYQLILLRGSLLQAMGQIVVVVALVLLLTRKGRPDTADTAGVTVDERADALASSSTVTAVGTRA